MLMLELRVEEHVLTEGGLRKQALWRGCVQENLDGTRQDFPRQKHEVRSFFFSFLTVSDEKGKHTHIKRQAEGEF